MKPAEEVARQLTDLYALLLQKTFLRRAESWRKCFTEYGRDEWNGEWIGVYVLWENEDDFQNARKPVYVGEGVIGDRLWVSFQERPSWRLAQLLTHDLISGNGLDHQRMRRLFEQFLFVTLEPIENVK
jgi:hypothetical protein